MEIKCSILKLVKTTRGTVAVLDFSNGFRPKVGVVLKKTTNGELWQVIGTSLPILIETVDEQIESPYQSEAVWHCLLHPINHENTLSEGDALYLASTE